MTKSEHDNKQDIQLAVLESSGAMMKLALPILFTIAMSAAGFAWKASSQIAVLEAANVRMLSEMEALRKEDARLSKQDATVQDWVEGNYVSKNVYQTHTENHK